MSPGTSAGLARFVDADPSPHLNSNLTELQDYDKEDLKGESEPAFSLDRALKAHRIDDNGIEMSDHSLLNKDYHRKERDGSLDQRDPINIAGDDAKYVDLQRANDTDLHRDMHRTGSLRHAGDSLKKRIGSLRRKHHDDD